MLAISGEQGAAKTLMSKILKALIDPSAAPVRALPREEREPMIAANNGYLLAFDNLCGLPAWLSERYAGWRAGDFRGAAAPYRRDEVDRLAAFTYGNMAASPLCETFPTQHRTCFQQAHPHFATQMEALKRYRIGGEQKVTVQHARTSCSLRGASEKLAKQP